MRESLTNFIPGLAVTPGIALLGIALMLALGMLTGLAPALNAMRLKTAVALGRS
jgi:putative ABC transport system permease protein